MGMRFLRAGASATEAVEASLRILEDKEITNAGYGSNLSIDGTVECDATIVDHLGRSGACGAVPGIRNPISLAKLILDMTSRPLSLRRVPPNTLVGEGARVFAEENGMVTYPNEHLVSKNARDRFLRWHYDLFHTDDKVKDPRARSTTSQNLVEAGPCQNHQTAAIMVAQAASRNSAASRDGGSQTRRDELALEAPQNSSQGDGVQKDLYSSSWSSQDTRGVKRPRSEADEDGNAAKPSMKYGHPFQSRVDGEDIITDTIGAIAVDEKGHIAAGSSSGGIGMKHRGRLGPAALVGIGTAVVPCTEDDEEGITVAAVSSGTGEHMATTMASQRCADRIYRGTRKGPRGVDIQDDNDDAIINSFIAHDFINHPGVKNSHSAGAIGVMVVKRAPSGYYLHFAHNTDSFALASMGGTDEVPVCTMSRLPKKTNIIGGGRRVPIN
ncbi:hypothetical protein ACO1O0_006185 [Amphichorda felina]